MDTMTETEAEAEIEHETTFGVVIPVRNGAGSIRGTLAALANQDTVMVGGPARLHVVVAVNGSTDDSVRAGERAAAELAGEFARRRSRIDVISTGPGRATAFTAAELLLPPGPRLYLDQDALLAPTAFAALTAALCGAVPQAHFAVPQLELPALSSAVARAYYRTFLRLPYTRSAPISVGAYAVSAAGRQRWADFPSVHSDDKFVRLHFAANERVLLTDTSYTVSLPDSAREIIRARRRYSGGNRELARRFPRPATDEGQRHAGLWYAIALRPTRWADSAVYLALYGAGHLLALAAGR